MSRNDHIIYSFYNHPTPVHSICHRVSHESIQAIAVLQLEIIACGVCFSEIILNTYEERKNVSSSSGVTVCSGYHY